MTDNNELAEALAEIAVLRRRWSDSESKLAACDSDLRTILAERDALRAERDRMFLSARDWATRSGEQEARAERLAEALRPFAALYQPDALCAHSDDQPDSRGVYGINAANITLGDLRRARAAMAAEGRE